MKQQRSRAVPSLELCKAQIQAYVSRFNLVRECFTGNTFQMSCGALTVMQYKIRRRNVLHFHLSCTQAHTHTQTFSFKTCSSHSLSLWLGSALSFASVVTVKGVFAVQLHFLINVLLVCLIA